ncbi:competence/damage-inducible protein A [Deferribacterales bacterium RsTz2092]
MLECAILAIGEELLEGSVVDTNSSFLGRLLVENGATPRIVRTVGDSIAEISAAMREAMDKCQLVLTTGGLGPTFDDLTSEAMAKACDKRTILYEEVKEHVQKRLNRLNLTMGDSQLRQAMLPEDAILFKNEHGTAYGFGSEYKKSLIIAMPGVPAEMKIMFSEQVLPFIKERFNLCPTYRSTLRFAALPESKLDDVISKVGIPENVRCIINASSGEVLVKVRSENAAVAKKFADAIRSAYPEHYYGKDDDSPAGALVEELRSKNLSLAVAESCTGGLLGGAITDISGSSDVFYGGVISYANDVKRSQLNVSQDILDTRGAVSEECAMAMADGVSKLMNATCAISITGVAGPGGGTPDKPVGTVWLCAKFADKLKTKCIHASGGRADVRARSVKTALLLLLQLIRHGQ